MNKKIAHPTSKRIGDVQNYEYTSVIRSCESRIHDENEDLQRKIQEQQILISQLEYLLTMTEVERNRWKRIACA